MATADVLVGGDTAASDYNGLRAATDAKPIGRLVQATAQSIPNNADTAITFATGSTATDPYSFHSETTNTTRVTPTVAGWYRIYGSVMWAAPAAAWTTLRAAILRGGTAQGGRKAYGPNNTLAQRSCDCWALLDMNGSTDYFELSGYQNSGAAVLTTVGSSFVSILEWEYVRAL